MGLLKWLGGLRTPAVLALAAAGLAVLFGVAAFTGGLDAPPASPAGAELAAGEVAKCRAFLATAGETGVIRARPSPERIDVDEALWAQMRAREKDLLLQALACDLWARPMPPGGAHVVAYGWQGGNRLQMLTALGLARE